MSGEPLYSTAGELAEGRSFQKGEPLIRECYLHFNGPGAAGFGVKRAAMLLPESVMLLTAPGCCGRHGTITGAKTGFENRIFYLRMEERDVVTGNYLKKIPKAAAEVCRSASPKALLLCMTCVDAILGTDLDRIGRQIEAECKIPVAACFMDPITRESKKPPMVSVQNALMQCIVPMKKSQGAANILGNFVPIDEKSEFKPLLQQAGFVKIRQISECSSFDEYLKMGEASLNIVINSQAQASADHLEKKCDIPSFRFVHTYGIKRTEEQYRFLGEYLGTELDISRYLREAEEAVWKFFAKYKNLKIAVGEAVNGNPFEIALTFLESGIDVPFVFRNILIPEDRPFIKGIAEIKPKLKIYSGVHPSMLSGFDFQEKADVVLGLDAGYFLPEAVSICWNMEQQPLGFESIVSLCAEIEKNIENPVKHRDQIYGSYLVV